MSEASAFDDLEDAPSPELGILSVERFVQAARAAVAARSVAVEQEAEPEPLLAPVGDMQAAPWLTSLNYSSMSLNFSSISVLLPGTTGNYRRRALWPAELKFILASRAGKSAEP